MKTKIIVDTNILLYALDNENIYHSRSVILLNNTDYDLHITTKNVAEYFAVSSKLNINFDRAFAFYRQVLTNVRVLFPNPTTLIEFERLIQKYQPRGNKVFDIEIAAISLGYISIPLLLSMLMILQRFQK